MKTSELTGALLDYWVAMADAVHVDGIRDGEVIVGETPNRYVYAPSTNWAQGGPIIERERISLWRYDEIYSDRLLELEWFAALGGVHGWDDGSLVASIEQEGKTALIAAMRAYVSSKYGDTVPNDLPT